MNAFSSTASQLRRLKLGDARQLAIFLGAYFIYMVARIEVLGDVEPTAISNASKVINFQESLGIFWELRWQSWAFNNAGWFLVIMNWVYIVTFWPIIAVAGFTIFVKDRSRYFYYRNVLLITFAVALSIFTIFPLAPLRLVPDMPNFVDTIQFYGPAAYAS